MRYTVILLLYVLLNCPYGHAETNIPTPQDAMAVPSTASSESAQDSAEEYSVIEVFSWASILPEEFLMLHKNVQQSDDLPDIANDLAAVEKDLHALHDEVISAGFYPHLLLMQIDSLQLRLNRISSQIDHISKLLEKSVSELSGLRKEWEEKQATLIRFAEQEELKLVLTMEQREKLGAIVTKSLDLIDDHLTPNLDMGKDLANLKAQAFTIANTLELYDEKLKMASVQQSSPPILSGKFYKQVNQELFILTYRNIEQFVVSHIQNLRHNTTPCLLLIGLFMLLMLLISASRQFVDEASKWFDFASSPASTAIFALTSLLGVIVVQSTTLKLDLQWSEVLNIFTMLSTARLIKVTNGALSNQLLLRRIAIFMAITMLLIAIDLPRPLMLFFVFYASIATLILYFLQLRHRCGSNLESFLRKIWGIIPASFIFSGIAGYDQFSISAFTMVIYTLGFCLVMSMLYRFNRGLLDFLLLLLPVRLIRENHTQILKALQPLLACFHIVILIAVIEVIWNIYPSTEVAINKLSDLGFDVGTVHISPGLFLTVALIAYGIRLVSKSLQALLLTEILPRYNTEKGVQTSISRLANYVIVTIGVFLLLRVVGFDTQRLAIIGGALGVGIGFGLQAIVNNFASGLILLFERPIKIGDTVQIGGDLGEVKKLGLRSTIIETFDNAEIVVPNSNLITGQVVNWTLAERRVRVVVSVGVAYGTDISLVIATLQGCAAKNSKVLNSPEPQALLTAFGASSLDFELRVFIPEFLDKDIVRSELNQSIEIAFSREGIEMPNPQMDINLRTASMPETIPVDFMEPFWGVKGHGEFRNLPT